MSGCLKFGLVWVFVAYSFAVCSGLVFCVCILVLDVIDRILVELPVFGNWFT